MKRILKRTSLTIAFTYLLCSLTTAQDKLTANSKSETSIELMYFKKADLSRKVVAVVTSKNKEEKFIPAKNVRVNFYTLHEKAEQLIKSAMTNNKGQASIEIQKDLPLDDSLYFSIEAKIENDSLCENVTEQIHYKDADMVLNLDPRDTTRRVTVKVTEKDKEGKLIPVKDAELKFYVQRLFGILPASEDNTVSTDENGEASFKFPKNIPGDTAGIITLVARIEDNKKFGNIENKASETWGKNLALIKNPFPRALWEPYAPLPLVITISTLFGGVWLIYFFIFYQLRKIKKDGELNTVKE